MPSRTAAPKIGAASGSVSDGQSPLGSWSTGPPSTTPQRSPAPAAAAAAAAISGAGAATCAPAAPGSYDGSSISPDIPGPDEYVQLTRENKHFCARALRDEADQRPRRCDLYGNKTWALLSDGKRGSGGTLGFSFEYAEPIAAFLCQADLFLQDVIAGLDDGSYTEQDLRYQLTVLGNSTREVYALANEHRALLELKAKALSGDDYDKQCTKHVERTFHVRDYASPDLPADIAEARSAAASALAAAAAIAVVALTA